MSRVIHFEIPVDDANRASAFYREVFGWQIGKWDGPIDYWLVTTGGLDEPGIGGALTRRSEGFMSTVNTIGVVSVDDAVRKIAACGGKILLSKTAIPGVGWLAYAQDTEGNNFGIMQADPSAQ